ncbi:MAG TPA: class I SAM-dependent methyltransferase [Chitinophagaceae bacterium]|nr:class I SAM-dependent methyltransferase [Chitinophagaceae bacterium]
MIEEPGSITCIYCGAEAKIFDKRAYHRYAPEFGPFRIFICKSCGALLTNPVPDDEVTGAMYRSFDGGMFSKARELRRKYPLKTWFRQCLKHMMQNTGLENKKDFTWIDIGAGEGEMSELMLSQFPNHEGTVLDFHSVPERLRNQPVNWIATDLNKTFPVELEQADLVFAITVLEHMADPVNFIRSALGLVKPGGVLYFNCPRTDCNAFKILGKKWPYYIAGEHITIPSIRGLQKLMDRECARLFKEGYEVRVRPVILPYPFGFYLGYYLPFLERVLPFSFNVYLPTGLLECQVIRHH